MSFSQRGNLQKLHESEMEIVKLFDKICRENGLSYYLVEGSLLGAVRHKGFIPWDDDIDIGMPRKDYERFLKIAPVLLEGSFQLKTFENSSGALRCFGQIINTEVKLLCTAFGQAAQLYAWIDIFPLDGMPNHYLRRRWHMFKILVLRAAAQFSQFDLTVNVQKTNRPFHEKLLISLGKRVKPLRQLDTRKIMRRLEKMLSKYDVNETTYSINAASAYKSRAVLPWRYFGKGREYDFEGISLKGPDNPHEILASLYGDYMTPPPEDQRNTHETKIID